jgi:hypothetical protein
VVQEPSEKTSTGEITDVVTQPIVDEVCEKTRALLLDSDVFADDCVVRITELLSDNRDKLKSSDVLSALSDPSELGHENT